MKAHFLVQKKALAKNNSLLLAWSLEVLFGFDLACILRANAKASTPQFQGFLSASSSVASAGL